VIAVKILVCGQSNVAAETAARNDKSLNRDSGSEHGGIEIGDFETDGVRLVTMNLLTR